MGYKYLVNSEMFFWLYPSKNSNFVLMNLVFVVVAVILFTGCGTSEKEVSNSGSSETGTLSLQSPSPVATKVVVKEETPTPVTKREPVSKVSSTPTKEPIQPTSTPSPVPSPTTVPVTETVKNRSTNDNDVIDPVSSGIDSYKYRGLCSGLDYEPQKVKLVEIVTDLFSGITNSEERPRLHWIPATKDSRRGGIWLDIGFNGDEFKEVVVKKNRLDLQMRDAYDSLFNAGCEDLSEVSITAIQKEITTREIGSSMLLPVVVFKTTLRKAQADEVDWENKDKIDFNEVWRQLVLNPRWRKAIRESNDK